MDEKRTRREILKYSTAASSFAIVPIASATNKSTQRNSDPDIFIINNSSSEVQLEISIIPVDGRQTLYRHTYQLASHSNLEDTTQNQFAGTFVEPKRGNYTLQVKLPNGESETQDAFFTGNGLPSSERIVVYVMPGGDIRVHRSIE